MPNRGRKLKNASSPRTVVQWTAFAQRKVLSIVRASQKLPGLKRRGPDELTWTVDVKVVGSAQMIRLNAKYRKKRSATDVLSFSPPEPIRNSGYLGELVICLPVLKRQAVERKQLQSTELQILLVHGVLHLLGLDHEKDGAQLREMLRWEKMLLVSTGYDAAPGLIERTG
ncbi:MAG: rRNA maturation RNase YbeY [Bdellovibrionota bacterium]